jgi:hypothetical protein
MAIYVQQDGEMVRYDDNGFLDPVEDGANDDGEGSLDLGSDDSDSSSEKVVYAELTETEVAEFDASIINVDSFNFQDFNIQVMSANQVFSFCDNEYYGELLPLAGKIIGLYRKAMNEDLDLVLPDPVSLGCDGWMKAVQVMAMVAQIPVFAELLGANLLNATDEHVASNFRVSDSLYDFFEEDMSPTVLFSAYKEIYIQVRADAAEGLLNEEYDMVNPDGLQSLTAVEAMLPSLPMMNASAKTSVGAGEFESAIGVIFLETRKRFYTEYYPKFTEYISSIFSLYVDFESTRELLKAQVGIWIVREISKYAYSDEDSTALLEALLPEFTVNEETGLTAHACVLWSESGDLYAEYTNIRYEHFYDQLISEFPLTLEPFPEILLEFASEEAQAAYATAHPEETSTDEDTEEETETGTE